MIANRRVAVVLPAYNAARTLARTCAEIPRDIVDDLILTDDASGDDTVAISTSLGLHTIRHPRNRGYGGNQKTCYAAALERGARYRGECCIPIINIRPSWCRPWPPCWCRTIMMPFWPRASSAAVPWQAACRPINTWPTGR